ncbi:hypothetical protein ACOSQ3_029641 [Xanthoceras sorbifolium]
MISSGAAGLVASSGVSRGLFLVGSLVIPSCLSFGVRRGAGPTGVKSLGVLGVGCDGGLCVGEGRFLVPTAGGTVPDPGSDRAAGTVFLGPSERRVVGPATGSGLGGASSGKGVLEAAGCTAAAGGALLAVMGQRENLHQAIGLSFLYTIMDLRPNRSCHNWAP